MKVKHEFLYMTSPFSRGKGIEITGEIGQENCLAHTKKANPANMKRNRGDHP